MILHRTYYRIYHRRIPLKIFHRKYTPQEILPKIITSIIWVEGLDLETQPRNPAEEIYLPIDPAEYSRFLIEDIPRVDNTEDIPSKRSYRMRHPAEWVYRAEDIPPKRYHSSTFQEIPLKTYPEDISPNIHRRCLIKDAPSPRRPTQYILPKNPAKESHRTYLTEAVSPRISRLLRVRPFEQQSTKVEVCTEDGSTGDGNKREERSGGSPNRRDEVEQPHLCKQLKPSTSIANCYR